MKYIQGSTLIELVVFIVVLAIMGGSLLLAFSTTLQNQPGLEMQDQAINLARERMELVLGQRNTSGGALVISDLCDQATPPAICVMSEIEQAKYNRGNYVVTTLFSDDKANDSAPVRGKKVTVTVSKPDTGEEVAKLETVVTNY